jgi:hypothetical protein
MDSRETMRIARSQVEDFSAILDGRDNLNQSSAG